MKTVRQILAVAWTEFRFTFRRGAPVVITVLTGLLICAGILILTYSIMPTFVGSLTLTPEAQARWLSNGLTLEQHALFVANAPSDMVVTSTLLGGLLMLVALLFLPAASISAIPADRVYGVAELLRSTPLTGARYLVGKALGVLAAVALTGLGMLCVFFAAINVLFAVELHMGLSWNASRYFLELALLDWGLMLAWGTVTGVLLGVLFRSRKGAIFPGLLAGGLNIVFWLAAFHPPANPDSEPIVDRIQYFLLENYHSIINDLARILGTNAGVLNLPRQAVSPSQVAVMILTVMGGLLALGLLARLWLQWKENF